MTLINKFLTGAFAVIAFIAWIVSFGVIKKNQGKAEAQAESDASELEAIKTHEEIKREVKAGNRRITRKQLFSSLREHASMNSD